ncbi:10844_t:CDS:2, partial [Ambispora leptoticha]
ESPQIGVFGGFLDECEEKQFKLKIEAYCLSLENIIKQGKLNNRHDKAQLLLARYKKGKKPDYKEAREWRREKEERKSKEVGGPSIHFHQPTKKDQEDEEEDEGIDDPAIRYNRLMVGIETARENQTACLMTPLCWGVIDLRAENVSPCPKHPRVKEFLSDTEVQKLQQTAIEIINKESHLSLSAKTLLETLQCSTFSLKKLSKEKRARGIEVICSLLKIDAEIYDKDTQYVGECMDAFYSWVHIYGGTTNIERTVDMHLIGPFSKTPGVEYIYGESHSDADRDEKSSRSESGATGKACDFIFWGNGHEIENTGPTRKDHHKKSVTDFVDVINVARSQHISFQTQCIEKSGRNPLPSNIENVLKSSDSLFPSNRDDNPILHSNTNQW